MDWKIEFSQNVIKDAKKLKSANLDSNLKTLLEILKQNPYEPPYEKLSGKDFQLFFSRYSHNKFSFPLYLQALQK